MRGNVYRDSIHCFGPDEVCGKLRGCWAGSVQGGYRIVLADLVLVSSVVQSYGP